MSSKKPSPKKETKKVKKVRTAKEVLEASTTIRKKKRPSKKQRELVKARANEIVEQGKKGAPRISKTDTKSIDSILGDSAEGILQLLENNEGDSARTAITKKLLQSLVDIIPLAENHIRDSGGQRGVYQLTTLVTNVRELMIDMQAMEDRGMIGEALMTRVITPQFVELGRALVFSLDSISSAAQRRMSAEDFRRFEDHMEQQRISMGNSIQDAHRELQRLIIEYLQR